MLAENMPSIAASLMIAILAVLIDLAIGEPPERFHPTVWMGKTISYLKPLMKSGSPRLEMVKGALLSSFVIILFSLFAFSMLLLIHRYLGVVAYMITAAMIMKTTFAIRCMEHYTLPIARAIEEGDVEKARQFLPYIVRRNPKKLNESQIISAAVESIAEGTVDGITSPFFYFALFGVPGAVAFRTINTLDSMVGYKDPEHVNIGWFSARLDTLANYVPARLTALLMIVATGLLCEDWRNAWKILLRDKGRTESLNAGWSMSAMAGALNVRLEKPGFYALGDDNVTLSTMHIMRALRVMKLTAFLFITLIVTPLAVCISLIL